MKRNTAMKTIEEKAKAYDEALKWMRELYPGLHGATKEDAEHYFPELRESEDERIRKGLVKLLTVASEAYIVESTGIKKESYLAYLEKQEQKPAWSEEDDDWVSNFERLLEFAYEHDPHGLGKICIAGKVWLNDRLKAFRPSWKPSEDQIAALKWQVEHPELVKWRKGDLESLLEQLEKL